VHSWIAVTSTAAIDDPGAVGLLEERLRDA
jgi:hypothetical protein